MLSISAPQFQDLGQSTRPRSVRALVARLRADHPRQTEKRSDAELEALIDTAIGNAARYDLRTEGHVRFYAGCMLRHGPDFDVDPKRPWAGDILEDPALDADEKVTRLDEVQVMLERETP